MTALLDRCRALDIRLWSEGGRLRFDAPHGAIDPGLRAELVACKAELIALLGQPTPPDWPALAAQRWGPALDHDEPGIDVPTDDWRCQVAHWPHERWSTWRDRAEAILAKVDAPGVESIRAAEHRVYREMTEPPPKSPLPRIQDTSLRLLPHNGYLVPWDKLDEESRWELGLSGRLMIRRGVICGVVGKRRARFFLGLRLDEYQEYLTCEDEAGEGSSPSQEAFEDP